jgi:CRISPR/Cas system-associated exonuclease Cas4 (RecB family)
MVSFVETAHEFFESINSSIRKNDFHILPKVFNSNKSACKYCTYKDICYVKESQKLYLTPEAKKVKE